MTHLFKVMIKALDIAVDRSFLQSIEVSIKPNKVPISNQIEVQKRAEGTE
jgi:hypothetical protein